jgi:hypothetical protein
MKGFAIHTFYTIVRKIWEIGYGIMCRLGKLTAAKALTDILRVEGSAG